MKSESINSQYYSSSPEQQQLVELQDHLRVLQFLVVPKIERRHLPVITSSSRNCAELYVQKQRFNYIFRDVLHNVQDNLSSAVKFDPVIIDYLQGTIAIIEHIISDNNMRIWPRRAAFSAKNLLSEAQENALTFLVDLLGEEVYRDYKELCCMSSEKPISGLSRAQAWQLIRCMSNYLEVLNDLSDDI